MLYWVGNGNSAKELPSSEASLAIKERYYLQNMHLCITVNKCTLVQTHSAILKVTSRRDKEVTDRKDRLTEQLSEIKRQLFSSSTKWFTKSSISNSFRTMHLEEKKSFLLIVCQPARPSSSMQMVQHKNWSDDSTSYSLSLHQRMHAALKLSRNPAWVPLQINILPPCMPYGAYA